LILSLGHQKQILFFVGPPEFATQSWEAWTDDWMIRMGIPMIVDESTDSEIDILVYQDQERDIYLDGFQARIERIFTYIENFDPTEDEIFFKGGIGSVRVLGAPHEHVAGWSDLYSIMIDDYDYDYDFDDYDPFNPIGFFGE